MLLIELLLKLLSIITVIPPFTSYPLSLSHCLCLSLSFSLSLCLLSLSAFLKPVSNDLCHKLRKADYENFENFSKDFIKITKELLTGKEYIIPSPSLFITCPIRLQRSWYIIHFFTWNTRQVQYMFQPHRAIHGNHY